MQFSKTTSFIQLFVTLGYAFVGYSHRFKRRTCHTVRKFIQQAPHMDRQAAAVEVVRLITQEVKKLGVHERRHKIEGRVRVRQNHEQRRFSVAQGVQLQLVLRHEVPQLRDVKGRQAGAAGNQDRLQSFARNELSRTF